MSAGRTLLVLFGTQSGNAEDLAVQIGKAAGKYNLEAIVKGMDELQLADLANYSRILITCSTWGEGEQPDNAEDLWLAANTDGAPSMAKSNFSVLALGDSSYEFYCESGIQWDGWLESKGATRVYQRVDCDVDYEEPADSWMLEALACMGAVDDDGIFQSGEVDFIFPHHVIYTILFHPSLHSSLSLLVPRAMSKYSTTIRLCIITHLANTQKERERAQSR